MEYLTNGDFSSGKLEPWKPVLGSDIPVVEEEGRYHVQLSHGEKLSQNFWMESDEPRRFRVKVELRVEGGSGEAAGQVQLIWSSGAIHTFNLVESPEWRTVEIPANFTSLSSSNTIQLLVQARYDKEVSVRSVSVTDDTKADSA